GLVEAMPPRWQRIGRGRGFLDRKVAASLKQHDPVSRSVAAAQIPRPKGRGLIEAPTAGCPRSAPCRIPRPKARGLIEAFSFSALTPLPAFAIPRPKGRGLIEATLPRVSMTARSPDSSTETSRPH